MERAVKRHIARTSSSSFIMEYKLLKIEITCREAYSRPVVVSVDSFYIARCSLVLYKHN